MAMALRDAKGRPNPQLLSPVSSIVSSNAGDGSLPKMRERPLLPGGQKEVAFRIRVDKNIEAIERRNFNKGPYNRKVEASAGSSNSHSDLRGLSASSSKGYVSFDRAGKDIERLVEALWLSGTPSIQIPYLLNLSTLTLSMLPSLSPAYKTTIRLLKKLDLAFASLMQGRNLDTGEPLPEIYGKGVINRTEKVRIRSIAENTRIAVLRLLDDFQEEEAETDDIYMQDSIDGEYDLDLEDASDVGMEIAKVYERTLVELGRQDGDFTVN